MCFAEVTYADRALTTKVATSTDDTDAVATATVILYSLVKVECNENAACSKANVPWSMQSNAADWSSAISIGDW